MYDIVKHIVVGSWGVAFWEKYQHVTAATEKCWEYFSQLWSVLIRKEEEKMSVFMQYYCSVILYYSQQSLFSLKGWFPGTRHAEVIIRDPLFMAGSCSPRKSTLPAIKLLGQTRLVCLWSACTARQLNVINGKSGVTILCTEKLRLFDMSLPAKLHSNSVGTCRESPHTHDVI